MRKRGEASGWGKTRTSRSVAAVGLAAWAATVLGCMSFSLGGRTYTTTCQECLSNDTGLFAQEGEARVAPGAAQDVFYPIAYGAPPNLEIVNAFEHCVVEEQRADHFRVNNTSSVPAAVRWKTRGTRPALAVPVNAAVETAPLPAPASDK